MTIDTIDMASPEELAPILLVCLQRLGQHGRDGALALARLVADDDGDFDEAADWIAEIAAGALID